MQDIKREKICDQLVKNDWDLWNHVIIYNFKINSEPLKLQRLMIERLVKNEMEIT